MQSAAPVRFPESVGGLIEKGEWEMKCFNHHESDSVGQCKHCYKGLCKECAADTGVGIACKGLHEQDVEFLHSLIENNKNAYSNTPQSLLMSNLFVLLMGGLFVGYSLYFSGSSFLMWFGFLCIGYWASMTVYNFMLLKKIKTDY